MAADRTAIYGGRVRYNRTVAFEPVNLERLRNDLFAPFFSFSSISIERLASASPDKSSVSRIG
jgi:hypothetical protein